jgi:sigma-B regulation protein RsbU (phosphoserine phosphatase)
VDATAATVRFANAGVGPVMVRRAGGRFEERREGGILLGVQPQARYEMAAVELQAGDVVVLATDGLVEASRDGALFGVEGVAEVLGRCAHRRAADIVEELLRAVRAHADGPLDDLTIVVLKQLARPAGRPAGQVPLKSGAVSADKRG